MYKGKQILCFIKLEVGKKKLEQRSKTLFRFLIIGFTIYNCQSKIVYLTSFLFF